jgi:hypothetical protein
LSYYQTSFQYPKIYLAKEMRTMTIALIILVLLEALIIYGLVVSDRLRNMFRDILEAIKKAARKQQKKEVK